MTPNTIRRKAWVIYFPQFDKYYPYVGRGSNSLVHDIVGADNAHVFTNVAAAKRVLKLYKNLNRGDGDKVMVKDKSRMNAERVWHSCIPNCVAVMEMHMKNTPAFWPDGHWFYGYDSSKSVVHDPYNTPLEVELIEFEINIPTK